ncbi:MAG: serine hydrolase, partial [Limisphaerales bacterium]
RIKPIFYKPLLPDSKLRLEVDRFGKTGPAEKVGASYSYSNAGYNSLGAIAEVVSGNRLEEFLHKAIYRPLGMNDSYHHEVAEKLDGKLGRMSVVYYRREGKWTVGWKPGQPPKYPFVRASGGMISTARDYAVFCQMFLNGGVYDGRRILAEETVRLMTSPFARVTGGHSYGYGWRVGENGVFAHAGSDGTAAWIDPSNQLVVLVFTPSPHRSSLREKFFQLARVATNPFSPVEDLAGETGLPDPFRRPDGSRVTNREDWKTQREWLKQLLAHYMYGRMPPRPTADQVTIRQIDAEPIFGNAMRVRLELTVHRNDRDARLRFSLIRPSEGKRCPTIIKNCRALFDQATAIKRYHATVERDLAAAEEAVKRGYILCKFRREDFAVDQKNNRDRGIFPLYPEYDWGSIAVWAWTHQVVLDALDRLGHADLNRIVATGHSRGGQTAIAAGIYDERIDVVVPCTGGYGSCATLRIRDPKGVRGTMDYLAHLKKHVPHWFNQRYQRFVGQPNKLPFDSHTLVSLIAPRPLLNTNATEDEYNNTLAVEAGVRAGSVVYDWLGREGWARLHWRPGKHAQQAEDWSALLDFADEAFFDQRGQSRFDRWQFPDYSPPLKWSKP